MLITTKTINENVGKMIVPFLIDGYRVTATNVIFKGILNIVMVNKDHKAIVVKPNLTQRDGYAILFVIATDDNNNIIDINKYYQASDNNYYTDISDVNNINFFSESMKKD